MVSYLSLEKPVEWKAVRGMHDLYGSNLENWSAAEAKIRAILEAFGYQEIRTPALERVEVFRHAVGDETDIVEKQMYTVLDRSEHKDATPETLVLRPEGTAGFVRAVVEHQLHQSGHAGRYYYYAPMYRYERPQKGRLRQFHQFGCELINDPTPEADAELLILLDHLYRSFGLTEYEIHLNNVGSLDCRVQYRDKLKEYFRPKLQQLCDQCRKRFERAPMRILDCKNESCQKLAQQAPLILDHLDERSRAHHEAVKRRLRESEVTFIEDPHIVRGLDYYCLTAFEFTSSLLGAQSALGGGGRYDGLSERFGKTSFPAVGWALGMERLMLALEAKGIAVGTGKKPFYFLAPLGEAAFDKLFALSLGLRRAGIRAEMAYDRTKGLKWQLKQADRVGARFAVLVGDTEMTAGQAILKDLSTGSQQDISFGQIESELKRRHDLAD